MHPISPFITETLWGEFGEPAEGLLITAPWPELPQAWIDVEADAEMAWVNGLIDEVRSIRAETNVPPQAKAPLVLIDANAATRDRLGRHRALIERLARLSGVELADAAPAGAVQFVIGEATGALAIADVIDVAAERTRLAMPETSIGLFPDVGGGWHLSRLPGRVGVWLALTGARLDGADCLALGAATHLIASDRIDALKAEILAVPADTTPATPPGATSGAPASGATP